MILPQQVDVFSLGLAPTNGNCQELEYGEIGETVFIEIVDNKKRLGPQSSHLHLNDSRHSI